MFRESLRRMLECDPGFEVVGEAGNGRELLDLATKVAADVLLIDLAMPKMSGVEVLSALSERGLSVPAIVLTGGASSEELMAAVRLGARGVLMKDASVDALYKAVRDVARGRLSIQADQLRRIARGMTVKGGEKETRPCETLTSRERQVLAAVAGGATNKQIAARFGMREQTVKNHLSNIFDKIGVSNRLEVALYAVTHHLAWAEQPASSIRQGRSGR